MPDEDDEKPANPLTQALSRGKTEAKKPVEKAEGKKPVEKKTAPFPARARIRYKGTRRLFAGYEGVSILEPGIEYEVVAAADEFSIVVASVQSALYKLAICNATKDDWTIVPLTPT